jgi:hypothetical protein
MNFMTNHGVNLIDDEPYTIYRFQHKQNTQEKVPGYLVVSTAALNVEDKKCDDPKYFSRVVEEGILELEPEQDRLTNNTNEIIKEIAKKLADEKDTEIVINIHGYSFTPNETVIGCEKIYNYINKNIEQPKKYIFIGYRWPSENPLKADNILKAKDILNSDNDDSGDFISKLKNSFLSLPILLASTLFIGILINIISIWLLIFVDISLPIFVNLFTGFLIITGVISSMIFTLITMRISAYFRDVYRASNYGVIDMVDFIRTLDHEIHNLGYKGRVKLSFIGHSLGCFVVTNVIRILSDVFDVKSIDKNPSPKIGNVFRLERLILVAPDIPVETILPGRANFLRSCLRRFSEAYIFSNEADLPLRFTSTAANYFSFPAKTRNSGYRLGNVTVSHFRDKDDTVGKIPEYGIVNLKSENNSKDFIIDNPYNYLEIRSSNQEHIKLKELEKMRKRTEPKTQSETDNPADLFTYFDCTDYKDDLNKDIGVLSHALQKPAISLMDYLSLTFAFMRKAINSNSPQGIDTHCGYFEGIFSQEAIYKLAFLGFDGFLDSLLPSGDRQDKIHAFSEKCKSKQIQVILRQKNQE